MAEEVKITIRMPKKEYERIRKLIKKGRYFTQSEIIRQAIREFLDKEGV